MGMTPKAKEAKTFVSAPAEAKLTTVGHILVPFTIINNIPKSKSIPFYRVSTEL